MEDVPSSRNDSFDSSGAALAPQRVVRAPRQDAIVAGDDLFQNAPLGGAPMRTSSRRPRLESLLRHKWLALLVFVLVGLPAGVGAWMLVTPEYEARALIEVSPMIPRIVYKTEDNGLIPLYQQFLNNQVTIVRSPLVLERVLDHPEIQGTQWFREAQFAAIGVVGSRLEAIRKELRVSTAPKTSFVDVRFTAEKAADATLIVNTVIDEYLKHVNEQARQFDDAVYQQLAQEHASLRSTIEGHKAVVARLRGDLLTTTPGDLLAQQRTRMDQKISDVETLQREIAVAQWQLEQLKALREPTTQPAENASSQPSATASAPVKPRYERDSEWRKLFMDVKGAEQRIALEGKHLGEEHFRMAELRSQLEHARENLRTREQQLDDTGTEAGSPFASSANTHAGFDMDVDSLAAHVERMRYEERIRSEDVSNERARVERTASAAQLLEKESSDLKYAEDRFNEVRQRKVAMEIERRAPGSIRIQDRAITPSMPSNSTRRLLLAAMGLLCGLGCGVAAAFVRGMTAPSIQQVDDFAAYSGAAVLGNVPLSRSASDETEWEQTVKAECIRMVRTAILERLEEGRGSVIQVTSAGPGAGKTSVALLLSESFAKCGKRVLLVDGDVRRPTVFTRCGVPLEPGLLGLLAARATDEQAIVHLEAGQFAVLPSGRMKNTRESELISNGALTQCMKRWRQAFDVILVDSPPMLPVADARILSRQVDGTVLVVREGHCQRSEVADSLAQLNLAGGRLLGVVFLSRRRGSRYYGGGYGAYYTASVVSDELSLDARGAAQ
ncbi:MAG: polysaccharide biosynthesis tyrosine autokinase [Phycisphaerales bacterium]|nr:polysaccharide biosynthesis tyrosine autokinase [Phycisphaerales bacterium]